MEREREVGAAAYYRFMVVKSEKLPMSSWRELLDFRFANAAHESPNLVSLGALLVSSGQE